MRKLAMAALLLGLVLTQSAFAAEPAAPAPELTAGDASILGLIEGVTEFLPVSSTGHLIIANHFLGIESDAANTFTVVIQFGAIAAVALLYRRQFASMARGLAGRDVAGLRLLVSLVVAFVPA